jgi:hypothetical protein
MLPSVTKTNTLPMLCTIERNLPRRERVNIAASLTAEWERLQLAEQVHGKRIALGFGSRGVAAIDEIARELVALVKASGGTPFIVPAMGSHGGATPAGQIDVLASLGITEALAGCPIDASMETVKLGQTADGVPVYTARSVVEADGYIVTNRVKPHTDFHGKTESGLVKMLGIGLGKEDGASTIHRNGLHGLMFDLPKVTDIVLRETKLICGIATVEDSYHQPVALKATLPHTLIEDEAEHLQLAHQLMPKLPVEDIDVLVIDQIGKEISGSGMDTNIVGRLMIDGFPEPTSPRIKAIVVLDLTDASHGNALGIGLADFTTKRLVQKIDFDLMGKNVFVSGFLRRGYIPLVYPTGAEAVQAAIDHVFRPNPDQRDSARVVRIQDTLSLGSVAVSPNLLDEIRTKDDFVSTSSPAAMEFMG